MKTGDIIINSTGKEYKILGQCGAIFFISLTTSHEAFGFCATLWDLERAYYKIKGKK